MEICNFYDASYDELSSLETIIKFTKDSCLEKEINAKYYNLINAEKKSLSKERNDYINMLNIALEKILNLKNINYKLESGSCSYKRTPTIAADR